MLRSPSLRWMVWFGVAILAVSACGTESATPDTPTPQPTRTLIPPTATPLPPAGSATPTPTDLPSPATIAAAEGSTAPPTTTPVERIIALTTQDLRDRVAAADIRLVSLEAVTWTDAGWGCDRPVDLPDSLPSGTPGYRIVYRVGSRGYIYHTDQDATYFRCRDGGWLLQPGEPVLVDPIAESMVALCRQDAARRLAVTDDALTLVSVVTLTWPDESLGCPQPGIHYEDIETPGYRIVLQADEATLIYHTSVRHLVLCEADDEILPGILRRGLATPTPETEAEP